MDLGELIDMCIFYLVVDGCVEENLFFEKIEWLK